MNDLKITVLMPVYNAGNYIVEAVQSVLRQTFREFELLIVNDGSTDDTMAILNQFIDRRIRIIHLPRTGICGALNKGLAEAKAEYIARFDADDICYPNRLQSQFDFLNSHPGHVLTGCDAVYIAENGEYLFDFTCLGHSDEEIASEFYNYCPFIHSGVMYRKQAVIDVGGYNDQAHNFEDYFLWSKLKAYGKYHNLPEPLIRVRFNPGSVTIDEKWRGRRFRQLKKEIITKGDITMEQGAELLAIVKSQDIDKIKKGAYNALCGKKFLVNNHQPGRARKYLAKAIKFSPLRLDNYALFMISFLPGSVLSWLHRKSPQD